jgi:hypothetical protein
MHNYRKLILPLPFESKSGQNNPENRQTLNYARGLYMPNDGFIINYSDFIFLLSEIARFKAGGFELFAKIFIDVADNKLVLKRL